MHLNKHSYKTNGFVLHFDYNKFKAAICANLNQGDSEIRCVDSSLLCSDNFTLLSKKNISEWFFLAKTNYFVFFQHIFLDTFYFRQLQNYVLISLIGIGESIPPGLLLPEGLLYLSCGEVSAVDVGAVDDDRDALLDAVLGDEVAHVVDGREDETSVRSQEQVLHTGSAL